MICEHQTRVITRSCLHWSQQSRFDWFQRKHFQPWLMAAEQTGGKSLWIKAAAKMTLMLKSSRQWPGSGGGDHFLQLKSDSLLCRAFEVWMKWDWMLFIRHTDIILSLFCSSPSSCFSSSFEAFQPPAASWKVSSLLGHSTNDLLFNSFILTSLLLIFSPRMEGTNCTFIHSGQSQVQAHQLSPSKSESNNSLPTSSILTSTFCCYITKNLPKSNPLSLPWEMETGKGLPNRAIKGG